MNHSSPGSYVNEIDRSQFTRAVSTTVGAIVGPSAKGPIMETVLVTNENDLISVFGRPDPKQSLMHYAVLEFLTQSSRCYVVRVANDDPAKGDLPLTAGAVFTVDDINARVPRPKISAFDDGNHNSLGMYDPYNNFNFPPLATPGSANQMFFVCAANPGTWNNSLYVEIRPNIKDMVEAPDEFYDDLYAFWVDVWLDYKGPRQRPDESHFVRRAQAVDGYGNQLFIEDVINNKSNLIRVRNNPAAPEIKLFESCHVFFAGGTNGGRVSMGQMLRGWDLYADPEHINVNVLIQGGAPPGMTVVQDIADIQRRMTQIAESRMDSIAVLDIPSSLQDTADALTYRNNDLNLDSSYAAIYAPDVLILDKFNDRQIWIPPSGFVAAAYAFTDESTDIWFAPAGMSRGTLNVLEARNIYNQGHRDALTDSQINAIRFFPNGAGYKIWGSDTMQTMASALSNVSVRRLMNSIEKAVGRSNLYSVFDPNDQLLRDKLRAIIERFLQPIRDAGGLYWFSVVCNDSNNPPSVVASGMLVVDAYFDPVITTKRIKLTANIVRTGASFRESLTERV